MDINSIGGNEPIKSLRNGKDIDLAKLLKDAMGGVSNEPETNDDSEPLFEVSIKNIGKKLDSLDAGETKTFICNGLFLAAEKEDEKTGSCAVLGHFDPANLAQAVKGTDLIFQLIFTHAMAQRD